MILGISFLIISLLTGGFVAFISSSKSELDEKQLEKFFYDLMDITQEIYFLGKGNSITLETHFPNIIESMEIIKKTNSGVTFSYLNVNVSKDGEPRTFIFTTERNFVLFERRESQSSCSAANSDKWMFSEDEISQGDKKIRVTSMGDCVWIEFV